MSHPTITTRPRRRDAGFTLPEMMISVVVTALIATTVAFAITVSLRTLPGATDTADTGVAVQGITTWLPPDVDSTEPDGMDNAPGRPSGCSGVDQGINLLHLSWSETFFGVTTNYVANYRFVVSGDSGRILRVACSGVFTLGSPSTLKMTAPLTSTIPTVNISDGDGDGKDDQVNFEIETKSGEIAYIDAASKNPGETLPPATTNPSTTTSTTTIAPNTPPVAAPVSLSANPSTPVVINLPASDADGDPLTIDVTNVPPGWSWVVTGPLEITLTPLGPPGTYVLDYEVEDPSGDDADSTITVTVTAAATTTSTSTTTTPPSTTLPPCNVTSMTVNPDPVQQKFSNPSKLRENVSVTITIGGGYCVGLTLQYDTGAPNSQYIQPFGNAAPYTIVLQGHPAGTELWAIGVHTLEVRDGFDNLLASDTLTVNPK